MSTLADRILDAALPSIAFDGWTQSTLERAALTLGLSAFDVTRAFPAGPIDAINRFVARSNEQMLAALPADFAQMKIRERIATAVMLRLRQQLPYREAVRRALAVYAMPWHALDGVKRSYETVDAIWHAAGDTSTDYNFYTKRIILSKVYALTLSVWLDDTSENLAETEAFLRRRIENVMQFEKFKAQAREKFKNLEQWLPQRFRERA
jgi:ubiquinone biosynthesis protein COQ9